MTSSLVLSLLGPLLLAPAYAPAPPVREQKQEPAPAAAAETPLDRRAADLGRSFAEPTEPLTGLFSEGFLQAVPPARVREICAFYSKNGAVRSVARRETKTPWSAKFELGFENGMRVDADLTVESEPPHRVIGLWLGSPRPAIAKWSQVSEALATLPGSVTFGAGRLPSKPGGEVAWLATHEPERALAIGSAFKLYVLGALVGEIEAGKRKWTDVVRLRDEWKSLPSGFLQSWPAGAPVTLHTLATLMISQSDNTATDHLLFELGRERVEAMLATMGNAHAERSIPMLSTAELFKLKAKGQSALRRDWNAADVPGRRALLAERVAPIDRETLDLSGFESKPVAIDRLEWFASSADLARAAAWLLAHTRSEATAPARGLLGVNLGLRVAREPWAFVGYKGGSETGVLDFTHFFEAKDGTGYVVTFGWNDPTAPVDLARLAGIAEASIELLAASVEK